MDRRTEGERTADGGKRPGPRTEDRGPRTRESGLGTVPSAVPRPSVPTPVVRPQSTRLNSRSPSVHQLGQHPTSYVRSPGSPTRRYCARHRRETDGPRSLGLWSGESRPTNGPMDNGRWDRGRRYHQLDLRVGSRDQRAKRLGLGTRGPRSSIRGPHSPLFIQTPPSSLPPSVGPFVGPNSGSPKSTVPRSRSSSGSPVSAIAPHPSDHAPSAQELPSGAAPCSRSVHK